jgi:uncharacterized protein
MQRTASALVAVTLLAAASVHAQALDTRARVDTVTEPMTSAKDALVREVIRVSKARETALRTMRVLSSLQAATLPLPPEFWDTFLSRAEKDIDTLMEPMLRDFPRYYTSEQLRALIVFYQSPLGQRMIEVTPVMSANSSYAGSQWGQRVGMEIGAEMQGGSSAKPAGKPSTKP